MSVRKRIERENAQVSAESREDVPSARDEVPPSVAAREMRCREREHRAKNKDLTEEEMMALAVRLSEQEADITAQRLHEEEEAVRKAIQDSMFSESQSLMDAPSHLCGSSRRKLVYSNGDSQIEDQGQRAAGHMTRKRKRLEGSPLKEMPDLSQTQPSLSCSEASAPGSQSPQSCVSTQIEDCDLPPSPVFPSSLARVRVHIPRLDQDLLNSCSASGVVLCSQGSALSVRQQSPTFPKSPENPTSTVEETNSQRLDFADNTPPELSQGPRTSPVFGLTEKSTSALKGETMEAFALVFSSQESSTSLSSDKDASLRKSPVFSKTQTGEPDRCEGTERHSPVFGADNKTVTNDEEEQTVSQTEPTIDMTLHWSEEDDDSTPVASPSPVFPEEKSSPQTVNHNEKNDPSPAQSRSAASQSGAALSEAVCVSGDSVPRSTVHYYWGVPFCPRGLDPDQYTKVIMAQLEVYEKSLKTAQRGLLNKATWGEPILPQPEKSPSAEPNSPPSIHATRRSRRLRGKVNELDSEDEVEDTQTSQKHLWEEEEAQEEGDNEGGIEKKEEEQPTERVQEEDLRENRLQGDSDCEVCPETQLSDDSTQELPLLSQPPQCSPETGTIRMDSPNVPEMQRPQTPEPEQLMDQDPEPDKAAGPLDLDLGDPPCQLQSRESPLQSQSADLDQHLNKNLDSQDLTGSDDDSALVPGPDLVSDCPIQCPLCQRAFPSDQIEMHAAYCDGGPKTDCVSASAKLRRKRTRRGEPEDANHTDLQPSAAPAQEKCYICLKAVPLRDYSLHTDKCFQRPRIRSATTGRLLSALDQSEPRISEAGPSGSTAQPQEVIDLVDDDDDDDDSVPLIQISNSPIRAFTSISNAQDCLIDFNRPPRDKRPGPRGGTKHRSKRR